ncbi:MAG: FAD:protein FMN transferase [Acidimicrobiia bacterium]
MSQTATMVETRFRAMGTDVHVVLVGGAGSDLEHATARVDELERRWSRFLPDSELSRLNSAAGRPAVVSRETFALVARAVEAWRSTGGAFDPSVLAALESAGYDRDFGRVPATAEPTSPAPGPAPGCAGIALDSIVSAITLPRGVRLDLGGIGKGYAADLVADELVRAGVPGVCVNLGGDLRVAGAAPTDSGWGVGLDDYGDAPLGVLALAGGAVATTTRRRRHWQRAGRELHHVIDPRTGEPARSGLQTVTVVAAEAWRAEVLAKAVFVSGVEEGLALLSAAGVTGLALDDSGTVHRAPGIEAFLR